jgi:hypothetical protein
MYASSASSYLSRARRELESGAVDHLFYAAFELRAGIEARLQEYLENADDVPSGRKRDWRIAILGISVDRAFAFSKVARVQIREAASRAVRVALFYTPVSKELQKLGMKLGDYLHAVPFRPPEDEWWGRLRTNVEVGCHLLEEATFGQLLGPPLQNKRTGLLHLPMELPPGKSAADITVKGESVVLEISYHESLADARGDAA